MNESPKLFVLCDCNSEGIALEVDKEHKEVAFAFFNFGHCANQLNFRQRLRHAWHVLRTGQPYEDMVLFNFDKSNQIAKFLTEELAK